MFSSLVERRRRATSDCCRSISAAQFSTICDLSNYLHIYLGRELNDSLKTLDCLFQHSPFRFNEKGFSRGVRQAQAIKSTFINQRTLSFVKTDTAHYLYGVKIDPLFQIFM